MLNIKDDDMGMNQFMGKVEIPVQQVIDVVSRRAAVYEILDKQGKQGTPLLKHALPRALARARALSFSLSSLPPFSLAVSLPRVRCLWRSLHSSFSCSSLSLFMSI